MVPQGNKSLPDQMIPEFDVTIWRNYFTMIKNRFVQSSNAGVPLKLVIRYEFDMLSKFRYIHSF